MVKKKAKVCESVCKCHAWLMLVLGLLILGNASWAWFSWPVFIGGLVVLLGLGKFFPGCHSC
ncbi:hypothetical protein ACFLZZ_02290 [Nanoarchaeota archaeon]